MTSDLTWLSALELRRLYRSGELSPVEVTKATLEQIARLNDTLTAFLTVTADLALEQAQRAETAFRSGHAEKPLQGIPVSLKDLTATRGIRTTRGSLLWRDWVPDFDSPVAERTLDAGAVLLGKTNTPEFGWKGDSGNRVVGPTGNPFAPELTAGGSSGGAAAAVGAGMGPLAQGTDAAGSVRIPASFCGVFAHKPSFGLVPYYPPSALELLATVGPITRSVRDAALYLDAIAGPDARDPHSFGGGEPSYLAAVEGGVRGMRVAWCPDLGFGVSEPAVVEHVAQAVDVFRELGCQVEEIAPGLPDPFPYVDAIWTTAQAAMHLDDLEQVRDRIDPGRLALVERAREVSGAALAAALLDRLAFGQRMAETLGRFDLLLTPTLPVTAFRAGDDDPGQIDGQPVSYLGWTCFTYPFNVTGQPAASVPCGLAADGMPVGLQIVGRWRDDASVLRAAAAFEEARPWLEDLRGAVDRLTAAFS